MNGEKSAPICERIFLLYLIMTQSASDIIQDLFRLRREIVISISEDRGICQAVNFDGNKLSEEERDLLPHLLKDGAPEIIITWIDDVLI